MARRHGIADDDMLHAVDHALAIEDLGDDPDRWLVIGPDRAANLLEVVVLITVEGRGDDHPRDGDVSRLPEVAGPMTKRTYGHTKSGTPVTDEMIDQLADESEHGYETDAVIARRGKRGRPRLGTELSSVESVRLDPELKALLVRRAEHEGVPVSEVIRDALREHLKAS